MRVDLRARRDRTEWYTRYSRLSDVPLLVLGLVMIVALLLPDAIDLTPQENTLLEVLDWFIYAVFALDLAMKLYLAPSIKQHLKTHWLDVLIVALPLLRPLRIVQSARLLRLMRMARIITFALDGLHRFLHALKKRSFHLIAIVVLCWVLASAALVTIFERNADGNIHDFFGALWWALATVTTVGYGDATPVSVEGRIVAGVLMVVGIAFYGLLTANIAAYFVEEDDDEDDKQLHAKLDLILARLDSLEAQTNSMSSTQNTQN